MGNDVRVENHGSLMLFVLETEDARIWVEEHVAEGYQMLGNGLAVEPRYAEELANGMLDDGLVVS